MSISRDNKRLDVACDTLYEQTGAIWSKCDKRTATKLVRAAIEASDDLDDAVRHLKHALKLARLAQQVDDVSDSDQSDSD